MSHIKIGSRVKFQNVPDVKSILVNIVEKYFVLLYISHINILIFFWYLQRMWH
jgi:hypothetical protein